MTIISGISQKLNFKNLKGRSQIVAKNAIASLMFKGFSILLGFAFVPLYLNSVGRRQYGIILTITSISSFISFFDVGIGNGLRSKLGKAITNNDRKLARQYVSTSYFYVTIFFSSVFLVYCLVFRWIKWYKVLNIPVNEIQNLDTWVFWVVALFVMRFIFTLVGSVLMADQKSSVNDSILFSTSFTIIVISFILKGMNLFNFYSLLITTCALPVLVLIIYSIVLYTTKYKWLRPSFSFVNHNLKKDILSLGFKFFLIQIVGLVIFATTNILIAQLFNIGEVTTYNIAFKFYNVTVMVFSILMSPLWGAFTNAWYQGDINWIIKNIKYYLGIICVFTLFNIAQFFIYPEFIHLWLKRDLIIPGALVISFLIYNFIFCYNDIFAHFLASIGQVNRQVYAAVAGGILNIPLTIYLAKHTNLGISVILFANVICLLPSTIVTTVQTIQLLRSKKQSEYHKKQIELNS